jgi:heme A synthase
MLINIIVTLHEYNAFLVVALGLIVGIWGLVLFFRKKEANRPWRTSLTVMAVLAAIQALFGIIMVLTGLKPGSGTGLYYLHYVYGAIVVLAIPVATTYATGGKNPRRDLLILSIAALILAAAGARGLMTGLLPNA